MANAVEDALSRASAEQREHAQSVIEEARGNIRLVSLQQSGEMTPSMAQVINDNIKVIEDAKQSIPAGTMQSVDMNSISSPAPTPAITSNFNSTVIEINPSFKSQIDDIERSGGNNYQRENAVDRAMERPPQEPSYDQQQQQSLGR